MFCLRRGTFCQQRQKVPKERRQNQGFEILPRLKRILCGNPPATQTKCSSLPPCFRIVSAPTSAGRSRGPALPRRRRDALCAYRPARCGHRALHKLKTYFRRGNPRGRPRSAPLPCTRRGRPPGRPVSPHSQPITLSLRRTIFISRRISRRPIPAPAIFDT